MTTDARIAARRAGELFEVGLNCTESIMKAFALVKGLDNPAFPRVATGFCAGVSRTCGVCGAVSGGVMVIGLELGRDSAIESNEMCYAAVQLFKDSFEKRFASDNCRVLTGCDFRTQEGRDEWEERNLKPRCREFVEVATELAIDAINTHVGSADA